MRAAILLLLVLLAGCVGEPPSAAPPVVERHATDCLRAPESETCTQPTPGSPLRVERAPEANRTRLLLNLTNAGDAPLQFDSLLPPAWFYLRADGRVEKAAVLEGSPALRERLRLEPGETRTLTFHYGKPTNASRARDVQYGEPALPEPWPERAYRACFSAHPWDEEAGHFADGWVRGCLDFRVRGR